jgi:hypothetical protein
MAMRMEVRVSGDAAEDLRQLAGSRLDSARQELVREAMIQTLQEIILGNPVDTARSRAAWVTSLEALGGSPPSGWEGPHPTAIAEGRGQGKLSLQETRGESRATADNSVDYVPLLEYGTSRMAPYAMVRRSLVRVAGGIASLFRL